MRNGLSCDAIKPLSSCRTGFSGTLKSLFRIITTEKLRRNKHRTTARKSNMRVPAHRRRECGKIILKWFLTENLTLYSRQSQHGTSLNIIDEKR